MKKTFLLFVTVCLAHLCFAQIKVDATGRVGIGTTPQTHKLEVSGNTLVNGNIYVGGTTNSLATNSNTPLIFKVNNSVKAGSTGSSGNYNVSFGYNSLSNSTGSDNTATGYYALYANTTGTGNIANGYNALKSNTTGSANTANGSYALESNTTGYSNTANGCGALQLNTTGNGNTAIGHNALPYNKTGNFNTTSGYFSLYLNTEGIENTASGYRTHYSNTTGSYNTAYGSYALHSNKTGYNNTAIGHYADVSAGNLGNATAIGNGAKATASNQVRIGNSSVTSIGGYTAWTNISDGRVKKNIRADVPGLNFINSLQPVTYNLDPDAIDELLKSDDPEINRLNDSLRSSRSSEEKEFEAKAKAVKQKRLQTGFVAQDVEKTAQSIGYDFSGVDVDESGIYGLRYAEFVVPLVKAVQELSEKNAELQELSEKSEAKNATLQEQVNELIEGMKKQQEIINEMKASCCTAKLRSTNEVMGESKNSSGISATEQAILFQNTPNPFNQTTEIGYFIPETASSANIHIYDAGGVQQKNISITERGNGVTVLQATSLQAGIYFYTLICDGKPVDAKQMILTR
jgi:hypothetical protein